MSNPTINWALFQDLLKNSHCPFALLATQMFLYSLGVLQPAQLLKSAGIYRPRELGLLPSSLKQGSGQLYSLDHSLPTLLEYPSPEYSQVAQFDELSTLYEAYVANFTQPIITEALNIIEPLLPMSARVLDLSCGPGTELARLARILPGGEIVGVDLSAGMIETAHRNARATRLTNVAFFQADAAAMPQHFSSRFDALLCSLAFHHYPRPITAAREMRRVLAPSGLAFIIDPGISWFNQLAEPLASWADPGWVSFYSAEDFHRIFMGTGFSDFYWTELLPGIGLSIVTK